MRNATKSPLFGIFQRALNSALRAIEDQTTNEEIVQRFQENAQTRRRFLTNTGKTLLVGGFSGVFTEGVARTQNAPFSRLSRSQKQPRIAIVGAGIAGLTALHTLKKAGYDATIYEASGRTSGRIFSVQDALSKGSWAEFGAEFIDTNHADMWALAKEFNLEFMDLGQASENKLTKELFLFEGKNRTLTEVIEAFRPFAPKMKADADRLPEDLSYTTKDPYIIALDRLSISEYLEKIGAEGWIKTFIETAYESEYGMSTHIQSSINLLSLISPDTDGGKFELYGDSDERYKVKGGNQSIPEALARKYAAHIELHRSLEAISAASTHYNLIFSGKEDAVKADFVIIAIPFSRFKNVDIRLAMPPIKWEVIHKLGFGTNTKFMLGMNQPFWRTQGFQGFCFSDVGIPNGWDNAQLQTPDNSVGGLSILVGGAAGVALGEGTPESQKDIYLPRWEKVFKGATENFNGKIARMHWASYPYSLGSYVSYTTGQYTSISGAEVLPVGNVFFAGEHCGGEFSGFMNGAAKSGREAAEAIIAK
ncbi:MAG: FAD-dependent oxidoreductase [Saprospiraceae bacterium]|nr:FAD-dependent oxidoreductase [Saprospiraceae bacterium]